MTRILIATQPAPGHVNPFLPVASTLSRRGHQVAWYTGAKFKTKVERTGAHYVPIVHG
jgi:UDP:flavonoid glycosyltransferase YjiC (YdhE family)